MLKDDLGRTIYRSGLWATSLMASGILAGCATSPSGEPEVAQPGTARPNVVATSTVLCDLTRQIAEDTVNLTCLMQPGQDPHVYEPTPSDRQAIEQADLVFYGGYGYEPDLIQIIEATQTAAPKVAIYELAVPVPLQGAVHEHDHADDHDSAGEAVDEHGHGDGEADGHAHEDEADHREEAVAGADTEDAHDHGESAAAMPDHAAEPELAADPHVWHDAQHGVQIVRVLEEQLSAIAPDQRDRYGTQAEAIAQELQALDEWIQAQVGTVPAAGRKLVTTHNSFAYYAEAYGFTVAGALSGLSTETRPSAAQLAALADLVKDSGVPAIFAEATTNQQLIKTVAREADVAVAEPVLFVEGPGGDDSLAPTYQRMLISNTCTIVTALGGQCDPATAPEL